MPLPGREVDDIPLRHIIFEGPVNKKLKTNKLNLLILQIYP